MFRFSENRNLGDLPGPAWFLAFPLFTVVSCYRIVASRLVLVVPPFAVVSCPNLRTPNLVLGANTKKRKPALKNAAHIYVLFQNFTALEQIYVPQNRCDTEF